MLTITAVARAYAVALQDDPYYYWNQTATRRTSSNLSYYQVTTELVEQLTEARAEELFYEYELSRGELAFCPETMPCYECAGFDGKNYVDQPVVALGPVINKADPTSTYRLACGHTAF